MRTTPQATYSLPAKDPAAWLAEVHAEAQAARFAEQAQTHAAMAAALRTYRTNRPALSQRGHRSGVAL